MPTPSQVILLLEDDRHQQFLFRYIRKMGFGPHAIRIEKSPAGVGSAEQWVRERFPAEVRACRGRQAQTILIVLIDADISTVQQRYQQLDEALKQAGVPLVAHTKERIARLVPKRNIETWILFLNGVRVDEETDYKRDRDDWSGLIRTAIDSLYLCTRRNAAVPQGCVGSLRGGIRELQKLEV
jgi:hypothetical protein